MNGIKCCLSKGLQPTRQTSCLTVIWLERNKDVPPVSTSDLPTNIRTYTVKRSRWRGVAVTGIKLMEITQWLPPNVESFLEPGVWEVESQKVESLRYFTSYLRCLFMSVATAYSWSTCYHWLSIAGLSSPAVVVGGDIRQHFYHIERPTCD